MQLSVKTWGPELGSLSHPKLIFLHGMGGTGALWRPIAAGLEDQYSILAPDQRGHGESQIQASAGGREVPGYTPLDYGRDVVETMEVLKFYPAFLIGHSMGVRSAMAVAHLRPEWVKGLILIDLGFQGVAGGGLGLDLAKFLKLLPQSFPSRSAAKDFMAAHCPDPSIAQYLMAVSRTAPDGSLQFPFDHGALIQTIEAARDVSIREWVREMGVKKVPIWILRGADSQVWSHDEFTKEQAFFSAYPSIQFEEIPGTGHGLPFEKRTLFVEKLKAFLKKYCNATPTSK